MKAQRSVVDSQHHGNAPRPAAPVRTPSRSPKPKGRGKSKSTCKYKHENPTCSSIAFIFEQEELGGRRRRRRHRADISSKGRAPKDRALLTCTRVLISRGNRRETGNHHDRKPS
eukprot:1228229-Amphidinium_carterae.5